MPSPPADLPRSPCVHQPGRPLNSVPWLFMEASIQRYNRLHHHLLVTDSTSSPFPLPEVQQGWNKSPNPLITWLIFWKAVPNVSWDPKVMSLT